VARAQRRWRQRPWLVSDDTEQTAIVAAALATTLDEAQFRVEMVRRMRRWFLLLPPAIGWGTLRACIKLCFGARSGVRSAGNAAAMRAAVIGVVARDEAHLDALVRGATLVTHTDPRALDAARIVALAARTQAALPELATACRTVELRDAVTRVAAVAGEPLDAVARHMAWERGVGAYCVDTVPAALLAARCSEDPAVAIETAIRFGGDTDTTAAIAGAIAGAHAPERLPTSGIPAGWRVYLDKLAQAIVERRPPPRRLHPLVAVPRNVGVGLAMVGVLLRARLTGW
jgi:ADP-ribosylglycohydrolase